MGGIASSVLAAPQQASQQLGLINNIQGQNPYSQEVLQNSLNNLGQVYGGQKNLASQLQNQAAGVGPNPSQTQYMQNIQQNIANAQGMIASQRGLNAGLATRMGANVGASANQQAAAQSALLQQQQQLGAQQNLGNLYGQMQTGQLGQQQLYNQANLGAQQLTASGQLANQQVMGQEIGAAGNAVSSFFGGMGGMSKSHGGEIKSYSMGGITEQGQLPNYGQSIPISFAGQFLNQKDNSNPFDMSSGIGGIGKQVGSLIRNPVMTNKSIYGVDTNISATSTPNKLYSSKGGKIPKKSLSPIGGTAPSFGSSQMGIGGSINFKPGGFVPGKANVSGDSLKNDTVPAMVSPGEIVIPRSIAQHPEAPKKSAEFVAAIMSQHHLKNKK